MQRQAPTSPPHRGRFAAGALAAILVGIAVPSATPSPAAPAPQFDEGSIIGISFYVPKMVTAERLIEYATSTMKMTTVSTNDERKRLVHMEGAVGIQGTAEERSRYATELQLFDQQLGDLAAQIEAARPKRVAQRLPLKTLSSGTVVRLIEALDPNVRTIVVEETGAVILEGLADEIESAKAIVAEVDVPQPHMRLYVELIEAYDEGSIRVPENERVEGAFAEAMASIQPGKAFRRRAQAMVRSAIGGKRQVELSTNFPAGREGAPTRTLRLEASPTGWDADAGVLTLDACSVEIAEAAEGPTQRLSAALALNQGETTVVGSLGGSPIYIALRFSVN